MNQFWLIAVIPVILSLLVNEFCDLAPWLAQKLVRRAANLWSLTDRSRAEVLAEEWSALVDTAPGKLTKVAYAVQLLCGAAWRFQRWRLAQNLASLVQFVSAFALLRKQRRTPSYNDWIDALTNPKKGSEFTLSLAHVVITDTNEDHFPRHISWGFPEGMALDPTTIDLEEILKPPHPPEDE